MWLSRRKRRAVKECILGFALGQLLRSLKCVYLSPKVEDIELGSGDMDGHGSYKKINSADHTLQKGIRTVVGFVRHASESKPFRPDLQAGFRLGMNGATFSVRADCNFGQVGRLRLADTGESVASRLRVNCLRFT